MSSTNMEITRVNYLKLKNLSSIVIKTENEERYIFQIYIIAIKNSRNETTLVLFLSIFELTDPGASRN